MAKISRKKTAEIVPGLTKDRLDTVCRMIECGVDEKDIPFILGTDDRHSLVSWQNQNPKIRHLFDKAREAVLNKVENALLRSALGGTLTTVKTGAGKSGEEINETTVKEVGPNIVACEKLLRLFRPEPWADMSSTKEIEEELTPKQLGDAEEKKMRKMGGEFFKELQNLKRKAIECKVV